MESDDLLALELQSKRARGLKTAVLLALLVVVLRYLPLTHSLFFFSLPESFAYDTVFTHRSPRPPADLALVAIDDKSLGELGQFPWPRDVYARLLEHLAGAKVVAFDLLFIEPDRINPRGDEIFAAAIKKQGRVVQAACAVQRGGPANKPAWMEALRRLQQQLEGDATYPPYLNPATLEELNMDPVARAQILDQLYGDALDSYTSLGGRDYLIYARSRDQARTAFKLTSHGVEFCTKAEADALNQF